MKKLIPLFLAAAILSICLIGCSASQTDTDATTEPTTPSIPGISVTPPGDMPEKPDADYTLPPEHVTIPPENISDR